MKKADIRKVKKALSEIEPPREREYLVRDATLAALKEVPGAKRITERISMMTKNPKHMSLGEIGSAELLFKLALFLEENGAWSLLSGEDGHEST